jgi:hypothetical protein
VVDLETATGQIIPQQSEFQSQLMPQLDHDLSRILIEDGQQLVSVGSHWDLTGPLPQEMREKMERTGLCLGCHQNMTNEDLRAKVNNQEHQDVMDQALPALADKTSEQFRMSRLPFPIGRER